MCCWGGLLNSTCVGTTGDASKGTATDPTTFGSVSRVAERPREHCGRMKDQSCGGREGTSVSPPVSWTRGLVCGAPSAPGCSRAPRAIVLGLLVPSMGASSVLSLPGVYGATDASSVQRRPLVRERGSVWRASVWIAWRDKDQFCGAPAISHGAASSNTAHGSRALPLTQITQ